MVPYVLLCSNLCFSWGAGMTVRFFPLFFQVDCQLSPVPQPSTLRSTPTALALRPPPTNLPTYPSTFYSSPPSTRAAPFSHRPIPPPTTIDQSSPLAIQFLPPPSSSQRLPSRTRPPPPRIGQVSVQVIYLVLPLLISLCSTACTHLSARLGRVLTMVGVRAAGCVLLMLMYIYADSRPAQSENSFCDWIMDGVRL